MKKYLRIWGVLLMLLSCVTMMAEDVPYAEIIPNGRNLHYDDYSANIHVGYDTLYIKYGEPSGENVFEINCDGKTWWANDKDSLSIYCAYIYIDSSFKRLPLKTTANMFSGLLNARYVHGLQYLNTDSVKDMSGMFCRCYNLDGLRLIGDNKLNTWNVTKMDSMFAYCGIDCQYSFDDSDYRIQFSLEELDTRNVTSMNSMFRGVSLVEELDLSNFDTRKVTDMDNMFGSCSNLKTVYVGDNWTTSALTDQSAKILCDALVGSAGTRSAVRRLYPDCEVAKVDGGFDNPGLFSSHKELEPYKELYAVLDDQSTLTLYYGFAKKTDYRRVTPIARASHYNHQCYYDWARPADGSEILKTANLRKVVIDSSVREYRPKTLNSLFANFKRLESVEGLENLVTDSVVDLGLMFFQCELLKSVDLSSLNLPSVKYLYEMFYGCTSLETVGLQGLGTQDEMDLSGMFDICYNLHTIYVGTSWVPDSIKHSLAPSSSMFYGCSSLVGGAGTKCSSSNVTIEYARVDGGEDNPGYLTLDTPKPYGILSDQDSSFTMYYGYAPENVYVYAKGGHWKMNDEDLKQEDRTEITKIKIDSSFSAYRPKSLAMFFSRFVHVEAIEGMEYLVTDSVTSMWEMFFRCENLKSVDLSHFNTERLVSAYSMFRDCPSLEELDLSSFNTSSVTNMALMFMGTGLKSIDLSGFDTKNVTNMAEMFADCPNLKSVNLSGWNTENVTDMSHMFDVEEKGSELTILDLSSFDTRNLTDMAWMFSGLQNLKTIQVGPDWAVNVPVSPIYDRFMFDGCVSLVGGKGTKYDENHVGAAYAHVDGGESNPGYLTMSPNYSFTISYMIDGEVYQVDTVAYGSAIEPATPKKVGYTFVGWDTLPETMPAENVMLTALFEVNHYTITYSVNEEIYGVDTFAYGDSITLRPEPSEDDRVFSGWSGYPESMVMPAEDIVVVALFDLLTGVPSDEAGAAYVCAGDGEVSIKTDVRGYYRVCDALGRTIAQGVAEEGETRIAVPQGVCVVSLNGGIYTLFVK